MIQPITYTNAVNDEVLIDRISKQHESALTELYGRYAASLKAVIGTVVKEEADADDVLQDILLQVWRKAKNYSPKIGKPFGWMATIARRRAIDRMRRHCAYDRACDRYEAQSETAISQSNVQEDDVSRADLRAFLRERLETLPQAQREALELQFFAGMTQREIAAATGTPLGTVKTRLELGLRKLTAGLRPIRHKV